MRTRTLFLLALMLPLAGCLDGDDGVARTEAEDAAPAWPGSSTHYDCDGEPVDCRERMDLFQMDQPSFALDGSHRVVLPGKTGPSASYATLYPTNVPEVRWSEDGTWQRRALPPVPPTVPDARQRLTGVSALIDPDGTLHAVWTMEVVPDLTGGDAPSGAESLFVIGYAQGPTTGTEWTEVRRWHEGDRVGRAHLSWSDEPVVTWEEKDRMHVASLDGDAPSEVLVETHCSRPKLLQAAVGPILYCEPFNAVDPTAAWALTPSEAGWEARELLNVGCETLNVVDDGTDAWLFGSDCRTPERGPSTLVRRFDGREVHAVTTGLAEHLRESEARFYALVGVDRDEGGSWHFLGRPSQIYVDPEPTDPPLHLVLDADWSFQASFLLTSTTGSKDAPEPGVSDGWMGTEGGRAVAVLEHLAEVEVDVFEASFLVESG